MLGAKIKTQGSFDGKSPAGEPLNALFDMAFQLRRAEHLYYTPFVNKGG